MASSCHCFPKPLPLPPSHFHFHLHLHPIITFYSSLVFSLFLFHQLDAVNASTPNITTSTANAISEFKRIRFHLRRLNKPYLKTIKAFIYILHKLMHFFLIWFLLSHSPLLYLHYCILISTCIIMN